MVLYVYVSAREWIVNVMSGSKDVDGSGLRVALGQAARPTEEFLRFATQLGVRSVHFNTPELPGASRWSVKDLVALRERCEGFGLKLEGIENIPNRFYERAMLGLPGRDEDIENVRSTIKALGDAGIYILGYNFMPKSVWRTGLSGDGRGGALISSFDAELAESEPATVFVARRDLRVEDSKDTWVLGSHLAPNALVDDDSMWENYKYFIESIIDAAEEAGVRLALHPDDPPVPSLGGVARIFRNLDALERARDLVKSPAWGLDLCLGTVSEMGGETDVMDAIERFGPAGDIIYVHLRDVQGTVPRFKECFLGEGNYDPVKVIARLKAVGFGGFIIDDHTPGLVGDSPYGHRGRAHAVGYMQGIIDALGAYDQLSTEAAGPLGLVV